MLKRNFLFSSYTTSRFSVEGVISGVQMSYMNMKKKMLWLTIDDGSSGNDNEGMTRPKLSKSIPPLVREPIGPPVTHWPWLKQLNVIFINCYQSLTLHNYVVATVKVRQVADRCGRAPRLRIIPVAAGWLSVMTILFPVVQMQVHRLL